MYPNSIATDFNDDTIFGGRGLSHTLGLNWYWNAYSRVQFNAIYGEIDDAAISDGENNNDVIPVIPVQSGDYAILGMRFMIVRTILPAVLPRRLRWEAPGSVRPISHRCHDRDKR